MIPIAVLSLTLASPVAVAGPAQHQQPAMVSPGFRWRFGEHTYEVVCVDETMVRYICVSHPWVTHGGLDGAEEPNWQSVGRTMREAGLAP